MAGWESSSIDTNSENNNPYGGPYVEVERIPPVPPRGFMFLDETRFENVHLLGLREVDQLISHFIDFNQLDIFLELNINASEKIIRGLNVFLRDSIFALVIREEARSPLTGSTFLESSNFEASQSCAHRLKKNIYKVLLEQSMSAFLHLIDTFNAGVHDVQLQPDEEFEEEFWQVLTVKEEHYRPLVKLIPWIEDGSDSSEDPVDSERQGPRFQVTGRNERPVGPTGPAQGFH